MDRNDVRGFFVNKHTGKKVVVFGTVKQFGVVRVPHKYRDSGMAHTMNLKEFKRQFKPAAK